MKDVPYHIFLNAGEKCQDDDIGVIQIMGFQGHIGIGFMNAVILILNMNTGCGKWRIIIWTESIEVFRINFCCPVAAKQMVFKEDTYFGNDGRTIGMFGGGNFDGSDKIFLTVGTQHANGELAACQDDRFA